MSGAIRKRSVVIAGHATSISLEAEFWEVLKVLALRRGLSLNGLVASIDGERDGNLSSALRLYVLKDLQAALRSVAEPLSSSSSPGLTRGSMDCRVEPGNDGKSG